MVEKKLAYEIEKLLNLEPEIEKIILGIGLDLSELLYRGFGGDRLERMRMTGTDRDDPYLFAVRFNDPEKGGGICYAVRRGYEFRNVLGVFALAVYDANCLRQEDTSGEFFSFKKRIRPPVVLIEFVPITL